MYDSLQQNNSIQQQQPSFEQGEEEDDDDYGFGNTWQGKDKKETQPEFEIENF
jgi:hypothetical protein